jgi:hypothetical protein
VIVRVTGAGGVKKPDFALGHRISIHGKAGKSTNRSGINSIRADQSA